MPTVQAIDYHDGNFAPQLIIHISDSLKMLYKFNDAFCLMMTFPYERIIVVKQSLDIIK